VILQDAISAFLSGDRENFFREFSEPIIIQFRNRRRFSSSSSGTSLSDQKNKKNLPQVVQLLKQGSSFPLIPLQVPRGGVALVRVGRSEQNDIVIQDDTVSARHAVFIVHKATGTVSLKDLASSNGTWVNEQRLVTATETVLFDGDTLFFGEIGFLFFYPRGLFEVISSLVNR